jgi:translation initiation factor IF-3
VFKDSGSILLLKFAQEIEDYGVIEQMPKLEGKKMIMMINPKKK